MNPNNCDTCGHDKNMCECPKPGTTIVPRANDIQVGGDHYKGDAYQHWDWIVDCNIGYLVGCATKYIMRHKKKNGKQDLDKAIHYVQKLTEVDGKNLSKFADTDDHQSLYSRHLTSKFLLSAKLDIEQAICVQMLAQYESRGDLSVVLNILQRYTLAYYPSMPAVDARYGRGGAQLPKAPTPTTSTAVARCAKCGSRIRGGVCSQVGCSKAMKIDSRTPWGMEDPRGYKGDG